MIVGGIVVAGLALFGIIVGCDYWATSGEYRDPIGIGGSSYGYIWCTAEWKLNCDAAIDYMAGTGDVISMFTKSKKEKACQTIVEECNSSIVSEFNTAASKSS